MEQRAHHRTRAAAHAACVTLECCGSSATAGHVHRLYRSRARLPGAHRVGANGGLAGAAVHRNNHPRPPGRVRGRARRTAAAELCSGGRPAGRRAQVACGHPCGGAGHGDLFSDLHLPSRHPYSPFEYGRATCVCLRPLLCHLLVKERPCRQTAFSTCASDAWKRPVAKFLVGLSE